MKRILVSVFIVTFTLVGFAQQDPQLTMWQYDRLSVNPAMSGIDRMHCITAIHRDQWDGLAKDPKTYLFNYSGMFSEKQNIGFGSTVYSEVLGQQQNTVMRFSPSYHLALTDGSFLSAGASIGFYQTKLGADWVYIDSGDPLIPTNTSRSQGGADIGLGVNFYKPGKFYAGVSATHLAGPNLEEVGIQMVRHYYVMGGYEAAVNSDITIRPNLMFKSDGTSRQIDLNADALFKKMIWGGLAYRLGDAISPYVGFQKDFAQISQEVRTINHGIRLGYSYDVNTSVLKDYSAGSHEIFVTYSVKLTPIDNGAGHSNPRFL